MSWGQLMYNACPRCRGTMVRDYDRYGTYLECLQCGHVIDVQAAPLASRGDLVARMEKRTGVRWAKFRREQVGTS